MEAVSHDDSSGANPSSVKSDDSSPRQERDCGSPPPNCAICLGTCRNKSFTDSCLHQFCFKCLLTWSKVKAECPLCKQNFKSIIHNVRSNHQYEEYMVEQIQTEETPPRFRYRTTLTLTRRETMAIQQLLPHYSMVADMFLPPVPRVHYPSNRRRSTTSFRRTVYRHNLWARPLPDFTGRYRDCTPEFYRSNDSQMHRLVPWLNRELNYLLNENVGHISYVISRILELLPQYSIHSPEFRETVQRYFGDRTEHFLHELYCFASTPYDMTGYDRYVQYTTDSRISTMVNEIISSSDSDASVDSDIVMVSSSAPAEPPPGPSGRPPAPVFPPNYISPPCPANDIPIPIETISHSDTDDDSSEVMVVGYIKPPHNRTPEIVDLLGSDSDVIVQDSTQPETSEVGGADAQDSRQVPLVKLSLRQHTSRVEHSDSDDSTYQPPPPPARARGRRKRRRSTASATTSDTRRSTPDLTYVPSSHSTRASISSVTMTSSTRSSPSPSSAATSTVVSSLRTSPLYASSRSNTDGNDSTSDSDTSVDTYKLRKRTKRKKSKRKSSHQNKEKKRSEKNTRSSRKTENAATSESEKIRQSKRKSNSGKGVKSSKRNESSQPMDVDTQPSTSGITGLNGGSGHTNSSGNTGASLSIGNASASSSTVNTGAGSSTGASRNTNATSSYFDHERRRTRSSHEGRKLRSVVNVVNMERNSGDNISNGNPNLLNLLSDAILSPNSNLLTYNSDSGSIPSEDRIKRDTDVPHEILVQAESCFKFKIKPAGSQPFEHSDDDDDDLPLNLTVHKYKS